MVETFSKIDFNSFTRWQNSPENLKHRFYCQSSFDSYKLSLVTSNGRHMIGLGPKTVMFTHIRLGPTQCPAARLKQMSVLRPGLSSATLSLDTIQLLGSTMRNLSVKLPPHSNSVQLCLSLFVYFFASPSSLSLHHSATSSSTSPLVCMYVQLLCVS